MEEKAFSVDPQNPYIFYPTRFLYILLNIWLQILLFHEQINHFCLNHFSLRWIIFIYLWVNYAIVIKTEHLVNAHQVSMNRPLLICNDMPPFKCGIFLSRLTNPGLKFPKKGKLPKDQDFWIKVLYLNFTFFINLHISNLFTYAHIVSWFVMKLIMEILRRRKSIMYKYIKWHVLITT